MKNQRSMASLVLAITMSVGTAFSGNDCGWPPYGDKNIQEGFSTVQATLLNGQFIPEAQIFYRTQGEFNKWKPTVVFLHFLEGSHRDFLCNQAYLSNEFFTISIDQRGRGDSSKTDPSTFNYTNQALAYDLHTVLQNLGITGPLILVGSVSGGFVALKYYELYGNRKSPFYDWQRPVSKFVFITSGPGLTTVPDCAASTGCIQDNKTCCPTSVSCPTCNSTTGVCCGPNCCICYPYGTITCTGVAETAGLLEAEFSAASCLFAEGAFAETCPEVAVARQAFQQDFLKSTPAIFISLFMNAFAEDLRGVVQTIKLPTLVTYGLLTSVPVGNSIYLNQNIPGSTLVEFVNNGESPNITDFITFNGLLCDFINGKPLAPSITINEPCCVCPSYVPTQPVPSCSTSAAKLKANFFKTKIAAKKS